MGLTKQSKLNANQILAALKTVDGLNSGLDADLLQGSTKEQIINAAKTAITILTSYTGLANAIPMGSSTGQLDKSWFPEGIGGIYVGSGTMPTWANIQIDPSGEAGTLPVANMMAVNNEAIIVDVQTVGNSTSLDLPMGVSTTAVLETPTV